jgi:hypothetical protein
MARLNSPKSHVTMETTDVKLGASINAYPYSSPSSRVRVAYLASFAGSGNQCFSLAARPDFVSPQRVTRAL